MRLHLPRAGPGRGVRVRGRVSGAGVCGVPTGVLGSSVLAGPATGCVAVGGGAGRLMGPSRPAGLDWSEGAGVLRRVCGVPTGVLGSSVPAGPRRGVSP